MDDQTSAAGAPIILKMGRRSAKKIKQLRQGRGPLMDRVMQAVGEMQHTGVIAADSQPLILVVRQESDSLFG